MSRTIDNGRKGCRRCGARLADYDTCSNPDCKNSGSAYYRKRRSRRLKGIVGGGR